MANFATWSTRGRSRTSRADGNKMNQTTEPRQELALRFARYSKYGTQFEKALDAALAGCVKKHLFLPSGRFIYTVVGSNADEFIEPSRPYCSCESYFYTVLSNKARFCYHTLGYKIAQESGLVREVTFDDEEYDGFMRALASDALHSRDLRKGRATGGI